MQIFHILNAMSHFKNKLCHFEIPIYSNEIQINLRGLSQVDTELHAVVVTLSLNAE